MKSEESSESPRQRVVNKLSNPSSLSNDIKEAKIRTSISNIEKTDGKFTANFSITGLPRKKDDYDSSYISFPKIFDDWDGFEEFAESFFNKSDDELISLAKENK